MSAISGAVNWAGKHPVTVAVGVFALGAVLLLVLRKPAASGNNGMSAFYAAQAAQAASGNSLMAVQNQVKGATAIAQIQADQNVQIATIGGQTSTNLAGINASVANAAELTRQEAQRQQFFLGVGQQQIEGAAFPYFLQDIASGNPNAGAGALAAWLALIQGGDQYHPAH